MSEIQPAIKTITGLFFSAAAGVKSMMRRATPSETVDVYSDADDLFAVYAE